MGSIRVLLALAVVCVHSTLLFSVGGKLAVQLFYMISGFLMSYILVEKQSYSSKLSFYKSRFLRLYPVYFAVMLATLIGYALVMPSWYTKFGSLPGTAQTLLAVTQLTLLGLEIPMFTGVTDGHLHFVTDYMNSTPPLFTGIAVMQAWTLSLELAFYLIAPLILPKKRLIIGLFLASLALRAGLATIGLDHDPWTYRFFPNELALFLGGALSHQLLMPRYATLFASPRVVTAATGALFFAGVVYAWVPAVEWHKEVVMFAGMFAALPFMLMFQNAHRWDAKVGNLSYPIYINHMFVLNACEVVLPKLGITSKNLEIGIGLVAVIVMAWALNRFVADPVDAIRIRYRGQSKQGEAALEARGAAA